ncbi:MAG: CoA-binding protein [Helicobacter sp.]|nr:CoA-binding protein [Helicobacteraceae bacterium]MDY3113980.1 CoA-binding protein [Helicobacter sp.]
MQDSKLKDILKNSKTIAILGLSPDSNKPSFKVAEFLQNKGYKIIPIYPKGGEILGEMVYQTLQEAFSKNPNIDILNIFRKSEALSGIANEILSLKTLPKCVWVQLGLQNKEAKALIESKNIAYIENLCIKLEHERLLNDSNF